MGDLRVGVVGVNGIGQAHLFAAAAVDGLTLAAACDVDAARAEQAAAAHSVGAFTDPATMFASGDVDVAVIATPPGTHAALVRAAVAAGLHVYCEKPFTPTAAEGYALAREAAAAGRVLQVGLQYRFHHGYAAARRLVAAGEIGEVFRADLRATCWFRTSHYFAASPWRGTWSSAGGGVLMSQAVHQVDALVAIAGMPSRVDARALRARHDVEVEDDVTALLEWPNGARGTLTASINDPAGSERLELHGERGAVVVDRYDVRVARYDDAQRVVDHLDEEFPAIEPVWEPVEVPRSRSEWFDMLLACHADLVEAVRSGRRPAIGAAEGSRCVELANAAYLSAVRGGPVDLPLDHDAYSTTFDDLASGSRTLPRHLAPAGSMP